MAINQDDNLLEKVTNQIIEEKCVLILGPDITGIADGKTINGALKEYLESNATGAIKYYEEDEFFSFTDPGDKISSLIDIKNFYEALEPNDLHNKIAEMPFHLIISVSPDHAVKKAFEQKGLMHAFDFYFKSSNPTPLKKPAKEKPLLYNLFGDYTKDESLILTYDDLFDYLASIFGSFVLPQAIQLAMKNASSIIFLGFKFEKWYFKLLLRLLNLSQVPLKNASGNKFAPGSQVRNFYKDEFKMKFLENYNETEIINNLYNKCKDKGILRVKAPTIFVSYAWFGTLNAQGEIDEKEKIVNDLCETLDEKGFHIIRDKKDLGYKGDIKDFMETIGMGNYVIVVISDKYLKSPNCMFEMLEIQKKGDVQKRIFPIVFNDAKVNGIDGPVDYLLHWNKEIEMGKAKISSLDKQGETENLDEKINLYISIRNFIGGLIASLDRMNTLNPALLSQNGFEELIKTIKQQIKTDTTVQ